MPLINMFFKPKMSECETWKETKELRFESMKMASIKGVSIVRVARDLDI